MNPIVRILAIALSSTFVFVVAQPARSAERVIYKRNTDRDLLMTITNPPGWAAADRRPAIIFFYNGGWKEPGATKPQFAEQTRYFAARGMVVGQADYREKSKEGPTSAKCVEDIFSGVRWLRSHAVELGVDPKRIAAVGGSGSIHLPAAALHADGIRAPGEDASIDPLPGAMFLFNPDPDVLEPAMMRKLVEGGAAKSARAVPPMVIYYGSRDAVAPFLDEFVTQARQAGRPVEKFVGDGGVHGFFKFTPGLEKTVEHMDRKLCALGLLDSEPKAELPHKAAPPDYEQRILATQQQWLEQHNEITKARGESPKSKRAQKPPAKPEPANEPKPAAKVATGAGETVVADAAMAPARRSFVYKKIGERKLELVAHYPADWKKGDQRPALLLFSGGGFNPNDKSTGRPNPTAEDRAQAGMAAVESNLGEGMVPVADYFTPRGVVAFRVDYRKRKTDGTLADKAVEDAGSAVRWIRQNAAMLGIDPHRVIACGGSAGGHLAAALAALDEFDAPDDDRAVSRRPDALILHSPLLDFTEGGTRATPFLAALNNDRGLAERLSPARHWRKDLPPTLLFTGAKEPVYQFLCDFAAKWKAAGQPIELVTGEGGHVYSLNEKFIADTLPRMENFLSAIGMLAARPREARPAGKSAANPPPPASYVYQTFGERKLQLAAHYPPGWKATDQRTVMLFFSGAHKVQPDANGKLPPLAAERAKLGLPVVNRGPGENHAGLCDAFAKLGLVCLRVEYRTRGRDGVLPGEDIADAFSAVRWVRRNASQLGIDPKRVVAAGGSSGGYLAASLFAFEDRYPDSQKPSVAGRPEAILLYSPLVDWLEVGSMSESFLVVLNGDKELGARVSPARHWRKDCPPTLVMVGSEEPPFATVKAFAEKWKSAGAPMELFIAEGGEHGFFGKPAWLEKTVARTEAFLKSIGWLDRATALAAPEKTGAAAALMRQLQSPDLPARTQAVLGLLELGQGAKEAFPSLVKILADDEALDTVIAARALYAKARPTTDGTSLAAALKFDTKARVPAAWELSRIGPAAGGEAAPALIAALPNPDKHERNLIVVALATTAAPTRDVVRALLRVLQDEGSADSQQTNYKYPRASAAIALGLMGAEANEAVPALVEILAEQGGWEFQRAANCFALGRIGPGASKALPALQRALQDASPIVRAQADRAIQAISPVPDGAANVAETVRENDLPVLVGALAGGQSRINPRVVDGLRALGEFAGATKLVAKMGSRKTAPPVHESIALAIGYLDSLPQPPSPGEIAREFQVGAPSGEVRQYIMALGGVQQGIGPVLLEALTQGERDPRVSAIRRLAALGPVAKEAIPALRVALSDGDWIVRREAFLTLSRIGGATAGPSAPAARER